MIVVLAVLAVLVLIVVTRGPQRSARLELDGAAREVATALRSARARAIASDRPVRVVIDAADHQYRTDGAAPRRLPGEFALRVVGATGAPAIGGAIAFLPDGSSSGGRVEIAGPARRVLIGVDWLTGRVMVADGA